MEIAALTIPVAIVVYTHTAHEPYITAPQESIRLDEKLMDLDVSNCFQSVSLSIIYDVCVLCLGRSYQCTAGINKPTSCRA